MDITKYNFEEQFDDIKKAIEESTFLAIDGEFTGLRAGSQGMCCFESPADRYRKIRNDSSDFLLIQFGLCAFKANNEEKSYEARPYNFYIFPRPSGNNAPDRRFLCQSSSIDFLISNNFDFNKLFKEGIPYLTHGQEMKLKADFEQRQADRMNSSFNSLRSPHGDGAKHKPFVVPDEHKEFIAGIREKMDAYLNGDDSGNLALPPCNAFQRKLIYHLVEDNYPLVHLQTKTGEKKERYLEVSRCKDENDAQNKEEARIATERMKLDVQVGFSKVMRLITESGKLVVGHNMFLDVIHSVSHFYGPLPQELEEFKEMIRPIFPRLLDTKLVANTNPFKGYFMDTSLEQLQITLKHSPFKAARVDLPEGFTNYTDGGIFHEAGYDAFVTGSCFASLVNFLGRYQNPAVNFLLPTHQSVQPFVNKLFMARIADIPYVDLAKPDVEPPRDHVFHVTFPEEWKSTDLFQLFEPYGHIQISWINKTSAYVGLKKADNAKKVISGLCKGSASFQIITYACHQQMMQMKSHMQTVSADCSTPTATPHTRASSSLAGSKRKSPPTDITYPPTKVQKRPSLTKETIPYPSIPEEEEDGKMEEEEEDLGVPVEDLNGAKTNAVSDDEDDDDDDEDDDATNKELSSPAMDHKSSSKGDKLFEEPDAW